MTRLFFTQTITLERLVNDTGVTTKELYAGNGTILGVIMQARAEDTILSEGNPSKSAVLYTEETTDVRETDRLTYGSDRYIVRGVAVVPGFGFSLKIKKAVIEKMLS